METVTFNYDLDTAVKFMQQLDKKNIEYSSFYNRVGRISVVISVVAPTRLKNA